MRIAICDDDEICQAQLIMLLKKYSSTHKEQEISYTAFSCADDLLTASESQDRFDVYILDIMMPNTNGIELGVKLRQNNDDGIIIYLTASSDFAVDSYNAKASGYLLKPVIPQQLFSLLEETHATLAKKVQNQILVKTKDVLVRVALDNILYVELCKRILVYHLTDGTTIESITLRVPFSEATQELLENKQFSLCSRSLIVNLNHITQIGNEEVLFSENQTVYFNKKICQTLRLQLSDYWNNM